MTNLLLTFIKKHAPSLILFYFIISFINVQAQSPSIQWQKTLGGTTEDVGFIISNTSDSGFVSGGVIRSNDGNVTGQHGAWDLWVVKQSKTGVLQWQKALGGSRDERGTIVFQTQDGGFLVGGTTASNNGNVSGNHGGFDIWIIKLTASGAIQWQKALGGSNNENLVSLKQNSNGEIFIGGTTYSSNGNVTGFHGTSDFWVIKLSGTGTLLWQKTLGGSGEEIANQLQITSDGGCVIAGTTSSVNGDVTDYQGGVRDYWIVKLSASGTLQWEKTLGGSGDEMRIGIQVTSSGFIIGGRTTSTDGDVIGNHGFTDLWIVKLNNSGEVLWKKTMGGTEFEEFYTINQTSDKGFIIGAGTYSNNGDVTGNHGGEDIWIIKLDSNGVKKWSHVTGSSSTDWVHFVQQTKDGGYIINGIAQANNGDVSGFHGKVDIWAVKLDASGAIKWKRSFGGSNEEWIPSAGVSLMGYFIPFASIYDNHQLQALDGNYMFIASTNSLDGDVSGLHYNSRLGLQRDLWVVKFEPPTILNTTSKVAMEQIVTTELKTKSHAYPNPFRQTTSIMFTASESGKAIVELYNAGGAKIETLFQQNVTAEHVYTINVRGALLPKGTYFYTITLNTTRLHGQLIKK